jgi:raffinose/stachyose/melibiose transport system permease protein
MHRYNYKSAIREGLIWFVALALLSPFYVLFNIALKSRDEFHKNGAFALPEKPTLDNFAHVLSSENSATIYGGIFNSFLITAIAVFGLIVFGSVTAYILMRRATKLSKFAYYMVLVGIIVPAQLGLVPLYIGAQALGLLGSTWGLGIIYIAMLMPLAVFLYGGFVRALPTEYEEAANLDGAGRFRSFVQVVFPLLAPATGTVATMVGIIVWNDFNTPLIFLGGTSSPTLPVAIYTFVGEFNIEWNNIFALLILAMIPITILYLVFQKKFIQGFSGGIKS